MNQFTWNLDVLNLEQMRELYGENDQYLRLIGQYFHVELHARGSSITLKNASEKTKTMVEQVLHDLGEVIIQRKEISARDVIYACKLTSEGKSGSLPSLYQFPLSKNVEGKMIYPKTLGQKYYVDALKSHDIVFGIGPAGTGKTYLAVVYAVSLWKKNVVKKIVLTRPAVEAGENLGFLPGDLKEKVDPYLRPLYDSLFDMLGEENCNKLMEKGVIEVAPLAYMRGRTLEDAFIILDEAQNTTQSQMKMFLTRMGFKSKMAITGDITQIDLPLGKKSGLIHACTLLEQVDGIAIVRMTSQDVVRHPLVQTIIEKYEQET